MTSKVLLMVTSHNQLGTTGRKTGLWFEELAAPYRIFAEAGTAVDIASLKGGRPPIDPNSETNPSEDAQWFLRNSEAMRALESTKQLSEALDSYDAYFVVGGHGVMWDLAESPISQQLLANAFDRGKVVAAVCHGPAALVNVRLKSGDYLVKDRKVSAFSNEEEKAVHLESVVPFHLETRLRERGALYQPAPMWKAFSVRDGRLITGQNPASSISVAKETLAALSG